MQEHRIMLITVLYYSNKLQSKQIKRKRGKEKRYPAPLLGIFQNSRCQERGQVSHVDCTVSAVWASDAPFSFVTRGAFPSHKYQPAFPNTSQRPSCTQIFLRIAVSDLLCSPSFAHSGKLKRVPESI